MLAEGFNGSTGIKEVRDKSQLKACWKNLKAKAKKDAAEERRGMFKTGGGPPPMITDPLSKKIINMIPQQISPPLTHTTMTAQQRGIQRQKLKVL